MKLLFIPFLLIQFTILNKMEGQSLSKHLWKDRVFMVFSSDENSNLLDDQIKMLKSDKEGLQERKLVTYLITPYGIKKDDMHISDPGNIKEWYDQFDANQSAFTVILIGLDGGEKHRQFEPITTSTLFGMIDRMPMRRAESRRKN